MTNSRHLRGIYAAALTPLRPDFSPALEDIPQLLDFLAQRGCHGVLLLGTTGEGPSFSPAERQAILRAALAWRQTHPEFGLLAGTGTPSLEETIEITRMAFDLGVDGVVVLPPYYYRSVPDDGLFAWFRQVLERAVPTGGALFGYHIPKVSGVALSLDLLERLKESFPDRFTGLKDSSGDPDHMRQLGARFGKDLITFTGNDRLLSLALENKAAGCITALANLCSPLLRQGWEAFAAGRPTHAIQSRLDAERAFADRYPPAPALLKALLACLYGFSRWTVRPPLLPFSSELENQAAAEWQAIAENDRAEKAG